MKPDEDTSMDDLEDNVRQDKSKDGLQRVWRAMMYSFEGIGSSLKHEAAFRQEMILTVVLTPIAIILPVGFLGKGLMIGSLLIVLITELLNSALEWTIDYISQETHPYAKRAKDMGSAAVFFALLNVLVVWILVILQAFEDGRMAF
ncbi:diacylglycerol kinase [Rubellicoccus peritrichatus]|uniref:Diacylglycerol kinase n=1 Tax=Rubellicoccus peritrichatus TaxID=3080537 RepID=A0AAQ3L7V5_9BACT|nr:diacylglycerol kinase [Puniceicoccus sp. CR14]WOO40671.1 diacylglycerol kinase [Puniceicoccus sp. CR14]